MKAPKRINYKGQEYRLVEAKSINENSYDDDEARWDMLVSELPELNKIGIAKSNLDVLVNSARSSMIRKHLNNKYSESIFNKMGTKLQEFYELLVELENEAIRTMRKD